MCGILLAVGDVFRTDFAAALATLRNRGPDATATLVHDEALLGHTRLAVIDPALGHQPMTSRDGHLAMVFNGEIYNFAALRRELIAAGHVFVTRSDSEVLLVAYQHWGEAVLVRLDGMFAFAIHDRRDGSVFMARDRLGIKPLFWGEHAGGIVAASTLAPFFALRCFPRRLDAEGLRDYLAFQTPLAPHTLIKDVHALPPGACLRWRSGAPGSTPRQWWIIPSASETVVDMPALIEETETLLHQAVKDQLVTDVPLGAFLSGGIDSSLIVHYMAQCGTQPLKTFSVRFPSAHFDESPAARAVAVRYATEHHVLDAPRIDANILAAALADLDQPLADPAYVPTWALACLTRQHVTVALSGDGGDELFGGYPRFSATASSYPDSRGKRLLRALIRHGWAPAALTRHGLSGADLLLYRHVELGDYPGCRKDLRRYLTPELAISSHPEHTLRRWRDLAEHYGHYDQHALLRADLWTYLSENCLTKTDRASMAHGLEVRVPLLANALLERILALPARVHFDVEGGKAILRALARRHLPAAVWDRPKHGFSVPLRNYLAGPWREWCAAQVAAARIRAPWLDARAIASLGREALAGHGNVRLFYTFVVLLAWLEKYPLSP